MVGMEALLNYSTLGRLVVGSVHDCDRAGLERALRDFDKQLYLKWNPKKRNGMGCWELRRRPDGKEFVYKTDFAGQKIYQLEYVEQDLVHHIFDLPYLSYELIGRLKKADTWNDANFLDNMEYEADRQQRRVLANAKEELTYEVKQNKRIWRDFAEFVSHGGNPGQVLNKLRLK